MPFWASSPTQTVLDGGDWESPLKWHSLIGRGNLSPRIEYIQEIEDLLVVDLSESPNVDIPRVVTNGVASLHIPPDP